MPTLPPIDSKWRRRALNQPTPDDLPFQLMELAPDLDAALRTPDAEGREYRLRLALDQLETIAQHVRVAARKAQAAQVTA